MEKIQISTEFIKLDQFLKFVSIADSGAMAKEMVVNGEVLVNDEVCTMRGKKLRTGDKIKIFDHEFIID